MKTVLKSRVVKYEKPDEGVPKSILKLEAKMAKLDRERKLIKQLLVDEYKKLPILHQVTIKSMKVATFVTPERAMAACDARNQFLDENGYIHFCDKEMDKCIKLVATSTLSERNLSHIDQIPVS